MNATQIITAISSVIKVAVDLTPVVIKTIEDAKPFAQAIYDTLIGDKEISAEELETLQAKILELSNQLQAPLPPPTDDEV
jgi:hypothetical protein